MEVQVRMVDALQGRTQGSFSSQTSPNFSRDDVHKSGRSIESVSSFKWWFQLFCGVFTPQKKHWAQYLYLPRGAVWMVRGAYTPSLRVQTTPFGRCWYVFPCFFLGEKHGKAMSSVDVCDCFLGGIRIPPKQTELPTRWAPDPLINGIITSKSGVVTPVTQLSGHWFKGPITTLINGSPFTYSLPFEARPNFKNFRYQDILVLHLFPIFFDAKSNWHQPTGSINMIYIYKIT